MFSFSITKSVHDEQQTNKLSVVPRLCMMLLSSLELFFFLSSSVKTRFFYLISYRFSSCFHTVYGQSTVVFVLYSTVKLRSSFPTSFLTFSPIWISLLAHRPPCSRNVSFLPFEEEEPASFYLRSLYATAMSLFTRRGRHVEDFFSHSQPI